MRRGDTEHGHRRRRGVLCVCGRWWRNDGGNGFKKPGEISAFPHPMGQEVLSGAVSVELCGLESDWNGLSSERKRTGASKDKIKLCSLAAKPPEKSGAIR